MNRSCRPTDLQQTANCVLTICLTSGGQRILLPREFTSQADLIRPLFTKTDFLKLWNIS